MNELKKIMMIGAAIILVLFVVVMYYHLNRKPIIKMATVPKLNYIVSTGGDYLVFDQEKMLTTTKNIEDATPISTVTQTTSGETQYLLTNADRTSYVSCSPSAERSASRIIYSKIPVIGTPATLSLKSLTGLTSVSTLGSNNFLKLNQDSLPVFEQLDSVSAAKDIVIWKVISQ